MWVSFENLESKIIFFKIDLKKDILLFKTRFQTHFQNFLTCAICILDLSILRITCASTCTIFAIANIKCNDPFKCTTRIKDQITDHQFGSTEIEKKLLI